MKLFLSDSEFSNLTEELKNEYARQDDGQYRLKVEGEIPEVKAANDRVSEFRNTNVGLMKKVNELETEIKRFEGIDPAEHQTLKRKVSEFERAGTKDPSDIDARLNAAVESAVKPLQEQLQNMQRAKEESDTALKRKEQETSFRELATKMNVRKSAISDFIYRGQQVFNLDGKAEKDGQPIFSDKTARELTMEEWATGLTQDAPHLFEESKGGGAGGNGSGTTGPGGKRTVSSDPMEFGRNLDDLAAGKARVVRD